MNPIAQRFAIALLILIATASSADDGSEAPTVERAFDGHYIGLGLASQTVIGGSFVGGRDVLAADRRHVSELLLGWRKIFGDGWVAGVELQVGRLDGDLTQIDDRTDAAIHYESDSQFAYGVTFGRVVGRPRPLLLFAYAIETERSFDVSIMLGDVAFEQSDEQGLLRYGLGVEWSGRVHWRATVGSQRADFGDLETNLDPDGEIEVSIAALYAF